MLRDGPLPSEASADDGQVHTNQGGIRFSRNPCAWSACAARKVHKYVTGAQDESIAQAIKLGEASKVQVFEAGRDLTVDSVLRPYLMERRARRPRRVHRAIPGRNDIGHRHAYCPRGDGYASRR